MTITNHPETSVKGLRKPPLPGRPEVTEPRPRKQASSRFDTSHSGHRRATQKMEPGAMPPHSIFQNDPHKTDEILNQFYNRPPGSVRRGSRGKIGPVSVEAFAALAFALLVLGVAIAAWLFGPVEAHTLVPHARVISFG